MVAGMADRARLAAGDVRLNRAVGHARWRERWVSARMPCARQVHRQARLPRQPLHNAALLLCHSYVNCLGTALYGRHQQGSASTLSLKLPAFELDCRKSKMLGPE